MDDFARRLRQEARALGLSDAEVARRAGLSERRYAYYATGEREPNLATLLRICDVLAVTPNDLLLGDRTAPVHSERDRLVARITSVTSLLGIPGLQLALCQLECLRVHLSVRGGEQRAADRRTRSARRGGGPPAVT
jgi:transcriptional regulator with XRE-family HTH domain